MRKLSADSGIDKAAISRFIRGLRGLSFENMIVLTETLGFRITIEGGGDTQSACLDHATNRKPRARARRKG
ncbi:MAG: hypothetical protein IT450_02250 [Phycisphaerales bacterium]|nr:hypothetical protein [Phycisphaerales bacterium]